MYYYENDYDVGLFCWFEDVVFWGYMCVVEEVGVRYVGVCLLWYIMWDSWVWKRKREYI